MAISPRNMVSRSLVSSAHTRRAHPLRPVIVEFDQPLGLKFIEFAEELERLLGREDVLTLEALKGIRIRRIAEDIAQSVVYV